MNKRNKLAASALLVATVASALYNNYDSVNGAAAHSVRRHSTSVVVDNAVHNAQQHMKELQALKGAAAPLYDIPLSKELQQYTYDLCKDYDIVDSYEVVLAMMWQESNFTADVVSSTGDYGIMQINRVNHASLKDTFDIVDIMEPTNNIRCGAYMFANLMHRYNDYNYALMSYNMGEGGAAASWSDGIYSTAYSREVIRKAAQIRANNYTAK